MYIRSWKSHETGEDLSAAVEGLYLTEGLRLLRGKKMRACISIALSMVNVAEIGAHEWRDAAFL